MYKRSKYGKLSAITAEKTPQIKLLLDLINHMDFKAPNIHYTKN